LIDRRRLGESVDCPKLEQLGAVFEIARPAGRKCLKSHGSDYTTPE